MELELFSDREKKLSSIIRFDMKRFDPMFYRTNLLIHSKRVYSLVKEIIPHLKSVYGDELDSEKALSLALVHDDAELVTGDVQLYDKERMTAEELAEVDNDEALAIEILAKKCEFVGKYYYRELLSHALNKDCLEAQIVSYCDKMDGFCEALHEIYAGNGNFRRPAVNYVRRINEFDKKYPLLEKMFTLNHVLVQFPQTFDVDKVISEGKLHTVDSILLNTASPHYEVWKKITVENLGMNVLINKIE